MRKNKFLPKVLSLMVLFLFLFVVLGCEQQGGTMVDTGGNIEGPEAGEETIAGDRRINMFDRDFTLQRLAVGSEGDTSFPEEPGSDVVALYKVVEDDFLYLVIERANVDDLSASENIEYNILLTKPDWDNNLQFLVNAMGGTNAFWVVPGTPEAEPIDVEIENMPYYDGRFLALRIPQEPIGVDLVGSQPHFKVFKLDREAGESIEDESQSLTFSGLI